MTWPLPVTSAAGVVAPDGAAVATSDLGIPGVAMVLDVVAGANLAEGAVSSMLCAPGLISVSAVGALRAVAFAFSEVSACHSESATRLACVMQ
jgi:hypothetical protein